MTNDAAGRALPALDDQIRAPRTRPIQRSEVLGPLRALADDIRLQILEVLALNHQMAADELSASLVIEQPTIERHLQQLVAAGLITEQETDGPDKRYQLHIARLDELFERLRHLLSRENAAAIFNDARRSLPKTLHRFVDGDGLITLWPRRERDREAVLDLLVSKFRRNHLYTEVEVNEILNQWHTFQDPANLRRQLADYGYLGRTSSGDRYWRER